jgi:hypothetical protein
LEVRRLQIVVYALETPSEVEVNGEAVDLAVGSKSRS